MHTSCFGLRFDNLWNTVTLKMGSKSQKSDQLLSILIHSCKFDENLSTGSGDTVHTRNCQVKSDPGTNTNI